MTRLMDTIGQSVRDRCRNANLSPEDDEIRKAILRFFARTGNPPTVQEIAEIVSLPTDVVNRTIGKLRKADVLTTQAGVITSIYPFSAVKTRHTVVFADGHSANALCATDALGVHFMLGEDVNIVSRCPECGHEILIVLKGGRVVLRDPSGAVEYAKARNHYGCTAETCCPNINLFCGRDHVNLWREKNPAFADGDIYEIEEALEDGRTIFGEFLK